MCTQKPSDEKWRPKRAVRTESLYTFYLFVCLTNNRFLGKWQDKLVCAGAVNCGKGTRKYMGKTNGR